MKVERYAVTTENTRERWPMTNKRKAIKKAHELANTYNDVSIYDYQHPDLKGIEYARRILHLTKHPA